MAAKSKEWECTAEMQKDLIKLHKQNKKKWHTQIATMIREHPDKFSILTVGVEDDGDNLYSFEEFKDHFKGAMDNENLLKLIYDDMDHVEDDAIKFIAIHRWMNEVKVVKQKVVEQDHKWLFSKIQPVQAAHLDADGSGEVDTKEFVDYFVNKCGVPEDLALAIFNDIDVNNDGDLSIMEYTRWKAKHNKATKLKKFFKDREKPPENKNTKPTSKPTSDPEPEKKCQDCDKLQKQLDEAKKQITELNSKYNEIELKFQSTNSKHSNLLQVNTANWFIHCVYIYYKFNTNP